MTDTGDGEFRAVLERNPAMPRRLLMGPGPVDVDPRVLAALAMPVVGQFDPAFRACMRDVMVLYRALFRTANRWTFCVDGTARAGIEAALVSLVEPGDRVLVPVFGRFGHLLTEIAARAGAEVHTIEAEWGTTFPPERLEEAVCAHRPHLVAVCHGDTSTTMAQPLAGLGAVCRRHDALLYVDVTATLGGMDVRVDDWAIDAASAGLQKCLAGPPGMAPVTLGGRAVERIRRRRYVERGLASREPGTGEGRHIASNYFDLAMVMDYWGEDGLNHHTEAASMLYAARECARLVLREGLDGAHRRHERAGRAVVTGLEAMDLRVFGDRRSKMANVTGVEIPDGVAGERVRAAMLDDFGIEIGTSFGPLHGRIWRIGTMGAGRSRQGVASCLAALEVVLRREGVPVPAGAGVDAALAVWEAS